MPEINEQNLAKIQRLLDAMDEGAFTKKDFVKTVENIISIVVKIEKKNTDAIAALQETYKILIQKFSTDYQNGLKDLRGQVDEVFVGKQVAAMAKEHREMMTIFQQKLSSIRDGKDGAKGERGEMGMRGERGSPDSPIDVRDKLERLQGEARLNVTAIQGLEELVKKSTPTRLGGGGGFSKIAMDSHIIDDETPTGTINGSNTVFTLAHTPVPDTSLKVYRGGARQRVTEDYTLSGGTITFTVAPVSGEVLLADYRH